MHADKLQKQKRQMPSTAGAGRGPGTPRLVATVLISTFHLRLLRSRLGSRSKARLCRH
jgi:hypothetical protein